MTKKIKHASKGEIIFLSNGNYAQLYTSILQTLGKNAPFAPISITSTTVVWENNSRSDFKSIMDAPDDIKGQLFFLYEEESKKWGEKLHRQNLDFVLNIPDPSYIFYAVDKDNDDNVLNNRYRFLITGWACRFNKVSNTGADGLEKDMVEAREKHQNVIVEMVDGDDSPLCNCQFLYNFNDAIVKEVATDCYGHYVQGVCLVGSTYRFTYKLTGQMRSLQVQKNIETYRLKYSPVATVIISIVDQFDKPVSSIRSEIRYGGFNCIKMTDGYGKIQLDNLLYEDPSLRIVVTPDGFPSQDFAVACPNCNIKMVVNMAPPTRPYVKVVRNGVSVSGVTVNFAGAFVGAFSSDADGHITLPDLLPGHIFHVSTLVSSQNVSSFFTIVDGKEEYIFEIPELEPGPTPAPEPVPNPDPKPSPDLQKPFECHIIVKAIEDDTPLANYSIKIESETVNGIHITDTDGIVPIGQQMLSATLKVFTNENYENVTEIVIEKNKNEYVVYVSKPVILVKNPDHEIPQVCHIKLLSKITGQSVPNYALQIDSVRMQGNYVTDENGILPLQNMTVGVSVTVIPGKYAPVQFEIEQYREEYIIQVDDTKMAFGDILITQYEKDKKTPIPNGILTLTNNKKVKFQQTSDASGNIVVPRSFFTNGEKVRVHLEIPNRVMVRDFSFKFNETCDHYIFFLQEPFNWKKLLYLMIPLLLLLLCLIRCERDITVQTVNAGDDPIPRCNVSLSYTEHAFCKNGNIFYVKGHNYTGITDNIGEYTFRKIPCSIFSYIFYSFHKGEVNAMSSSSSLAYENFLFHWTNYVKVILNDFAAIGPDPDPRQDTELLSPCNAGAFGRQDVAANTVSEPMSYNMGVTKGSFTIKYETGSTCADQIDLYNHNPGEDWYRGKLIFSSGMVATNGIVTEDVNFSNGSVVTIVVTTGPDNGSLWNYQLSCPH